MKQLNYMSLCGLFCALSFSLSAQFSSFSEVTNTAFFNTNAINTSETHTGGIDPESAPLHLGNGVVFHTDPAILEFACSAQNQGFDQIPDYHIRSCSSSVDNTTNDNCFQAGDLLPGFTLNTNAGNLIWLGKNLIGSNPAALGPNTFNSNLEMTFFPGAKFVGFYVSILAGGPGNLIINAYDKADNLLATQTIYQGSTFNFIGIESEAQIARVEINDETPGFGQLISSLYFSIPEIKALPCAWNELSGNGIGCSGGSSASYERESESFTLNATGCYSNNFSQDNIAAIATKFCGDGEFIAHISSITNQTFAGITLREDNTSGAKLFSLQNSSTYFGRKQIRSTTNGYAFPLPFFSFNRRWIKLVRTGNYFSGYISNNGVNWQLIAAATIDMPNCIQAVLQASNINANGTGTAVFDNVSVNNGSPVPLVEDFSNTVNTSPVMGLQEINLFPNPVSETPINVRLSKIKQVGSAIIHIQDATGRLILQKGIELEKGINTFQIDHQLHSGIYFLSIDGKEQWYKKKFLVH